MAETKGEVGAVVKKTRSSKKPKGQKKEETVEEKGKMKTSPRDVFTNLLAIIMLYASAISFLVLMFQIINVQVPDVLEKSQVYTIENSYSMIRGAIGFLVICFPVYALAYWMLVKNYASNPEKRNLGIHKWLLYFTLFVTALIIVGNLIALMTGFLRGELTMRFLFKVISVFFVAGSIFSYYMMDLKRTKKEIMRMIAVGVSVIILAAVAFGFVKIGSPAEQRLRRIDTQRVNDLSQIQSEIQFYYDQQGELPRKLANLVDENPGLDLPADPITGDAYEYKATEALQYELCATFDRESLGYGEFAPSPAYSASGKPETWEHTAGHACFPREVFVNDQDLIKEAR